MIDQIARLADKMLLDLTAKGYLEYYKDDYYITDTGNSRIKELVTENFDFEYKNKLLPIDLRSKLLKDFETNQKIKADHPVEQLLYLEAQYKANFKIFKTELGKELLQ
jgi:hypothetical protein